MWSPASAKFASIVSILVNFEAILKKLTEKINSKSQFKSNDLPQALKDIKITLKLTSIVTILVSIEVILTSIGPILEKCVHLQVQYSRALSQDLQVLKEFWCISKLQSCFKTYKYYDNTCEYCTCRWTHFSSIGSLLLSITTILTSIVTILVSIEQVNTSLSKLRLSKISPTCNIAMCTL